MTSSQTSLEQMLGVYKWVVDDVVSNMKEEFLNESVDLQVLEDLKQLWEQKLVQSGALSRPPKDSSSQKSDSHEKQQKGTSKQPQQQQQQQQQNDVPLSVIQQANSRTTQQQLSQPPPLIDLSHSNTSSSAPIDNSRNQPQTNSVQPQSETTSQQAGSQTGPADLLAQQAAIYSAMAAGIQPLMLPNAGGGLAVPMLSQGSLPYAAVQTPTGLSYVPFPVALNLQQQQQAATAMAQQQQQQQQSQGGDSRNKESSDSIPQNDGPLPQSTKLHERKGIHGSCTVKGPKNIPQLDGPREESSSEESDESSDSEAEEEAEGEEDEPLNTDDDAISDEEENVWDTDNTIVCQFEKVYRVRAKWKFALKDGIMNIRGHDYIFNRINGEADW